MNEKIEYFLIHFITWYANNLNTFGKKVFRVAHILVQREAPQVLRSQAIEQKLYIMLIVNEFFMVHCLIMVYHYHRIFSWHNFDIRWHYSK